MSQAQSTHDLRSSPVRRTASMALAAALILLTCAQLVSIEPAGEEFVVEVDTAREYVATAGKAVDMTAGGEFVVVWEGGGYYGWVGAQRFAADGSRVGSAVSPGQCRGTCFSSVATVPSGEFVVGWYDAYTSHYQDEHHVRAFDADGNPGLSLVTCANYGYNSCPYGATDVAADGLGQFLVTWEADRVRRFDKTLQPLTGDVVMSADLEGGALDMAPGGEFVVVWEASDGSSSGVFGQRFDATDVPLGSPFAVNTYTTDDQVDPEVAVAGDGGFVVAWSSYGQDSSGWGIRARRFTSGGLPVGDELPVNTFTLGHQRTPAVATNSSGNFVVTWQSYIQDGDGYGVFLRAFRASGQPDPDTPDEYQVNQTVAGDQWGPSVAMGDHGHVIVVWNAPPPWDGDVMARQLNAPSLAAEIFADGFESGDTTAWSWP